MRSKLKRRDIRLQKLTDKTLNRLLKREAYSKGESLFSINKKPHVDITCIIVTFNGERFLSIALDSLLKQDFKKPMEIFLSYDRGTKDRTLQLIKKFLLYNKSKLNRIQITLFFHDNTTLFRDREHSIRHAKGKRICFLDYDNIFFHDKLRVQNEAMDRLHSHFSFSSQNVINEKGTVIKNSYLDVPPNYKDPERILVSNFIDANEIMFDRVFYNKVLKPSFDVLSDAAYDDIIEDYFINCVAAITNNLTYLPKILGSYRLSKYSLTPRGKNADPRAFTKTAKLFNRMQLTLFALSLVNYKLRFYNKKLRFNFISSFSPNSDSAHFHFSGDFNINNSKKLPLRFTLFGVISIYIGLKILFKHTIAKVIYIFDKNR
jgi:glycosyltransferase involved in cell wall biosynthesis